MKNNNIIGGKLLGERGKILDIILKLSWKFIDCDVTCDGSTFVVAGDK